MIRAPLFPLHTDITPPSGSTQGGECESFPESPLPACRVTAAFNSNYYAQTKKENLVSTMGKVAQIPDTTMALTNGCERSLRDSRALSKLSHQGDWWSVLANFQYHRTRPPSDPLQTLRPWHRLGMSNWLLTQARVASPRRRHQNATLFLSPPISLKHLYRETGSLIHC